MSALCVHRASTGEERPHRDSRGQDGEFEQSGISVQEEVGGSEEENVVEEPEDADSVRRGMHGMRKVEYFLSQSLVSENVQYSFQGCASPLRLQLVVLVVRQ